MSVTITQTTTVARRYRAWCADCQDGYQGSKPTVTKWADRHNKDRHPQDAATALGAERNVQ